MYAIAVTIVMIREELLADQWKYYHHRTPVQLLLNKEAHHYIWRLLTGRDWRHIYRTGAPLYTKFRYHSNTSLGCLY